MYAIFEDGGRQYKVSAGDALLLDVRDVKEDEKQLVFDKVLMVGTGAAVKIGAPWVSGAKVTASIERELKMPKVTGIKFNRRKGYKKKWGHRQPMLKVKIDKINA